jgi:hypothetical protein
MAHAHMYSMPVVCRHMDAHLWPVCCAHQQHAALTGGRVAPLHLHQQLSLEAPAGLVLACSQHTVNSSKGREQPGVCCAQPASVPQASS